jgi:hypothetical protein
MHEYGVLWSSTGGTGNWAQYLYLAYDDAKLHENYYDKTFYYSVRCVRDKATGTNDRTYRGLLIYPNPFDHLLHVDQQEKNSDMNPEVQIFNQSGQLITSFTMTDRLHQENLQFLTSGIYFLKINTNRQVIYQKILKK